MGIIYYSLGGSPELWQEETSWIKFDISDSLTARTRILTIALSDPRNISSTPYIAYKRVKVVERDTGSIVFLGRVDYSEPKYDDQYGQIILIYVSDYSRELFERKVDSNYSGLDHITGSGTPTYHRRSELAAHLVADYTYPGSVITSIEQSGSTSTILKDYTKSGQSPAQIIESLASEDCWTDLTWGAAWRWTGSAWENDTAYANSTGTPTFPILSTISDYFYLGQNNPFLGAEYVLSGIGNYGTGAITWEYWNGSVWTVAVDIGPNAPYKWAGNGKMGIQISADWTARTLVGVHAASPPDSTSRYWLRCKAATVITPAQILQIVCSRGCGYDWYVNDAQVFQYFRRGSKPVGGPALNGLSVGLNVTETTTLRAMLGDYQFCDDPRETITRVTCYGTASSGATITGLASRSDLEAQLGIVKEKVDYVWGSNMSEAALQTYVNDRALMLLNYNSGTINRGSCKTYRYPYFGVGKTLVRVGDLIHVNITPKNINTDYLVLQVKYSEPPGTTEFQLVSMVFGRAFSPFDLTSTLQGLTSGQDISIASARIQDLVVDNAKINTCSINKLTAGTLGIQGLITSTGAGWASSATGTRFELSSLGFKTFSGATPTAFIGADGSGFLGVGSLFSWDISGVVTINGGLIINATIPSSKLTFTAEAFYGVWSSATTYAVGNEVVYLGNIYMCLIANTNLVPPSYPSYWQLTGTSSVLLGAWSGSKAYVAGNQVTYTPVAVNQTNIYMCISANTGLVPSSYPGYWTLLGPATVDALTNGSSYGKVSLVSMNASGTVVATGIAMGSYGWVNSTNIFGGQIVLNASITANGQWYNSSGVLIDSTTGITIYGVNMAFRTMNFLGGTVQCYMDSSGRICAGGTPAAVTLDSSGISIYGQKLFLFDGAVQKGVVGLVGDTAYFAATKIGAYGTSNVFLKMTESDLTILLKANAFLGADTTDSVTVATIGTTAAYWKTVFANEVCLKTISVAPVDAPTEGTMRFYRNVGTKRLYIYAGGWSYITL